LRYTHLFFDLDHTLWDFDRASEATLRSLWEEYNLASRGLSDFEAFAASYARHNEALWTRFRTGQIGREELRWKRHWLALLDFGLADSRLAYELSAGYLELLPTQKFLVPGAPELLAHVVDRYRLHLITNGFATTQWQKLSAAGIAHYFEEMITSERSGSVKPRREIFEFALRTCGADCGGSLMIGDAVDVDIAGALGAGMDAAWYNPNRLPRGVHKPTYEVARLEELMPLL